jgi:SAM-dependent methyltransferase
MVDTDFYARSYGAGGEEFGEWRAFSAEAKADHAIRLMRELPEPPRRILEVGCGDGALLAELARRGAAAEYAGFEIAAEAIDRLRARAIPGLARAEVYDGRTLPVEDGSWDVALLSHVLEHVDDPPALLREAARAARAVVVEVPLEDNVSGRRGRAERIRAEIGHEQRFDRAAVRELVGAAGLEPAAELTDPLTRRALTFHARTPRARATAAAKAAVRRAAYVASARLAERLFTVHYACLCVPAPGARA